MKSVPGGYEFKWLSASEFWPLFREHRPKVFSGHDTYDVSAILSEPENHAATKLNSRLSDLVRLFLVVYKEREVVGWSWGSQMGYERFYMVNSAVYPEHRRMGIYTELLRRIVERATQEGFQIIYSLHIMTNNAVIIPKLKAGFVISGMEVSERFGTLVSLMYFTNPERRRLQAIRCGEERMPDDLRRRLQT